MRGEWQVSRVYAVLNRPEPALWHARRCLDLCQQHGIGDFDLAFGYEAMGRAHAIAGQHEAAASYLQLARRVMLAVGGGPAGGDRPGISVTRLGPGHPAAGAE